MPRNVYLHDLSILGFGDDSEEDSTEIDVQWDDSLLSSVTKVKCSSRI